MGTHGNPWDPMGPHGFPWEPMGTHWDPWVPMGPHGSPWVPMGSHGFLWVPMGPNGFPWDPWDPMGPHGIHGIPWYPIRPHWTPLDVIHGQANISQGSELTLRGVRGGSSVACLSMRASTRSRRKYRYIETQGYHLLWQWQR